MNKKKNAVGRPPKVFKAKPKLNIKRPRGRPSKSDHNKIKQFSQNYNTESNFISTSINKFKNNSKADNIALGLLIFSILLFIFSLIFKVILPINNKNDLVVEQNPSTIVNENIPTNEPIKNNTETQIKEKENNIIPDENLRNLTIEEQTLINFYDNLNNLDFISLDNIVDRPLKNSNVFKTYYNTNRISNFIKNLVNNKIYITKINETPNPGSKTKKYTYELKYKLINKENLFIEERSASIVYRSDIPLVGSVMCITKGCSLNPFFNPQKYGK